MIFIALPAGTFLLLVMLAHWRRVKPSPFLTLGAAMAILPENKFYSVLLYVSSENALPERITFFEDSEDSVRETIKELHPDAEIVSIHLLET